MFRINGILTTCEGKTIKFYATIDKSGIKKALEAIKNKYDITSVCNNTTGMLEFGGARALELGKSYKGGSITGVLKSIR